MGFARRKHSVEDCRNSSKVESHLVPLGVITVIHHPPRGNTVLYSVLCCTVDRSRNTHVYNELKHAKSPCSAVNFGSVENKKTKKRWSKELRDEALRNEPWSRCEENHEARVACICRHGSCT